MKVLRAVTFHALFAALPLVAQDPFLVVSRQYSAGHGSLMVRFVHLSYEGNGRGGLPGDRAGCAMRGTINMSRMCGGTGCCMATGYWEMRARHA